MWCDNFDGDLYKLIPEAQPIVSALADVELFTHGSVDQTGRLNHPAVWNDYAGMIAFFGAEHPHKPGVYYTNNPVVACTAEEAIRDCFVHQYVIMLNGYPVWDSFQYGHRYISLLYDHRHIHAMDAAEKEQFRADVLRDLNAAANKIKLILSISSIVMETKLDAQADS